jgi:hypothetical protein
VLKVLKDSRTLRAVTQLLQQKTEFSVGRNRGWMTFVGVTGAMLILMDEEEHQQVLKKLRGVFVTCS